VSTRTTLARHLILLQIRHWSRDALAVWAVLLAGSLAVAFALSLFGPLRSSIWEQGAHIVRWAALIMGAALVMDAMPRQIRHGGTRRGFMVRTGTAALVITGVGGVLMAAGFLIENAVYRITGWEQGLSRPHLFTEPTQSGMVAAEFWLLLTAWLLAGAAFASGYLRRGIAGALGAGIPAAAVAVPAELAAGTYLLPVVEAVTSVGAPPAPVTALLCVLGFGVALTAVWMMLRDVALSPSPA